MTDRKMTEALLYYQFLGRVLISVILTIGAVFLAERMATPVKDHSDRFRHMKTLGIIAAAFFAISFFLSKTGLLKILLEIDPALPLWFAILHFRLLLTWLVALRMFMFAGASYQELRHSLLAFIVIAGLAIETIILAPAAIFLKEPRKDPNGVILQTLQVTCIPSSLATICHLYGESLTEKQTTEIVGTLLPGSLVSHTISGCRRTGFSEAAYSNSSLKEILAEDLPFIITFATGADRIEHAAGVIGFINGRIFLADPLRGLVETDENSLNKFLITGIIRLGRRDNSAKAPALSAFSPEKLRN